MNELNLLLIEIEKELLYLKERLRIKNENYKKLVDFLKKEISMRDYVCTTNHAVLLDNAKELLKEISEND